MFTTFRHGFCLFSLCCFSLIATAASYSGTLPVLFVQTAGGEEITSKEDYLQGTYYLDPMGHSEYEAFGTAEAPLPLQIRGRGNYTWTGFEKKPYRIKLDDKAALLGLEKSKHFALLAHADDTFGFLRNTTGFWLSEHLGLPWTPHQRPVELVLNGDYKGLYFLTETIRVDKKRVNIVEQPDLCTHPDSIRGGWLVEIDNYDSDPHVSITEGDGYPIIFTYKTPEELSPEQEAFLTEEMTRINALVYGDKQSDELWKYLDINDLARFFLVQELTDNYESFHGSCYLYRDFGADEKWHFGPVWDFGSTFNYDKTRPFYEGREHHNTWAPELAQFPALQERIRTLWQEVYPDYQSLLDAYLQQFVSTISEAAQADAKRWQSNGYGNEDIASDLTRVQQLLHGAAEWECRQLGIEPTEPTITVRWRPLPTWTDIQSAYVWGDGNGDRFVGIEQENEWYSYTTTATSFNIIFVNGTGWTTEDNQTVDITGVTASACYEVLDTTDERGVHLVTLVDCPTADIASPESETARPATRKYLIDGQIVIMRDGQAYDILGTPLPY